MAALHFTFLGTATSVGVPVIGCDCGVCQSDDPRNRRTRASLHVRTPEVSLLVDTGPDLREQALRENLRVVDAVLYTHAHLDHIAGFDELRAFCWHRDEPLPLHATPACLASLRHMFGWAFAPAQVHRGYVRPDPREIHGAFAYGKLRITPLPVEHGATETIGFLFAYPGAPTLAYVPDVKAFPPATAELIAGVDILILDALRPAGHVTHMSLAEALAFAATSRAGDVWLTHLSHEMDARTLDAQLPDHVRAAYDGLCLELPIFACDPPAAAL
jgi:phosphoribosyl 1,2-cyclic phosphate phosphodiesterase